MRLIVEVMTKCIILAISFFSFVSRDFGAMQGTYLLVFVFDLYLRIEHASVGRLYLEN